ncbi:uncharacterized protein LOC118201644, partial [Stegodyphus dumicola]|uniref:uncharacterized protein LOC118201644 n=1 Tax=Stegodyphus dumicola TaxID=202533 RepID=UPI0015A9109D
MVAALRSNASSQGKNYEEDVVKELLTSIISERKEKENIELAEGRLRIESERIALERLRLEAENRSLNSEGPVDSTMSPRVKSLDEIVKTIKLLTNSLEKALASEKVADNLKSKVLMCLLGDKAAHLLTYLEEEQYEDYEALKTIVLREYEPSPKTCLENFKRAKRNPEENFTQFATRLNSMWSYYCKLRGATDLETVNQLVVADRLMETLDTETATHIGIKQGENWWKPKELARECDMFFSATGKSYAKGYRKENDIKEGLSPERIKVKPKESYKLGPEKQASTVSNRGKINSPQKNFACYKCGSREHFKRDCPQNKNTKDKFAKVNRASAVDSGEVIETQENRVIVAKAGHFGKEISRQSIEEELCKLDRVQVLYMLRAKTLVKIDSSTENGSSSGLVLRIEGFLERGRGRNTSGLNLTREFEKRLGSSPRFSTPMYPQSNGLVERFNQTLKRMLHHIIREEGRAWHVQIPYALWAYREIPNSTTGVSPFQLLYGRPPQGPLSILKSTWLGEHDELKFDLKPIHKYLQDLKERLKRAAEQADLTSEIQQGRMAQYYNLRSSSKTFEIGDRVVVLIPDSSNRLYARWQGPATEKNLIVMAFQWHISQEVDKQVKELLELGLIEPSEADIAHPVVCVVKKDATIRMCVDFRALNSITKVPAFPMKDMHELIYVAGHSKWLSSLDMRRGYWQIGMEESSKPLTAFSTHNGTFQWNVMPFGLAGASGTFQREMNKVLFQYSDFAQAYIDDIIIFSNTFEEHLKHLETILKILEQLKFSVRLSKCDFAAKEIDYLGHKIGNGKTRPRS